MKKCAHGFLTTELCGSCTPFPKEDTVRAPLPESHFNLRPDVDITELVRETARLCPPIGAGIEDLPRPIVIDPAHMVHLAHKVSCVDALQDLVFIPAAGEAKPPVDLIGRILAFGEWAEKYEAQIRIGLLEMMSRQPRGSISSYERALDSMPSTDWGKGLKEVKPPPAETTPFPFGIDPIASVVQPWPPHTKPTELEPT